MSAGSKQADIAMYALFDENDTNIERKPNRGLRPRSYTYPSILEKIRSKSSSSAY